MISISPDDRLVAVGDDQGVAFYSMNGRQANHSIGIQHGGGPLGFAPNGKEIACVTGDGIHVYDVDTGALILKCHQDCVCDVLWSRDGSRFFSSSESDMMIRCWNSDTGKRTGRPWTGHTSYIRSLSLSPDGSILASASWDDTVRFWDPATGDPIGKRLQHNGPVTAVCFSPSGESVASAGNDGKIYLWRVP